jgi:hypothetical protein
MGATPRNPDRPRTTGELSAQEPLPTRQSTAMSKRPARLLSRAHRSDREPSERGPPQPSPSPPDAGGRSWDRPISPLTGRPRCASRRDRPMPRRSPHPSEAGHNDSAYSRARRRTRSRRTARRRVIGPSWSPCLPRRIRYGALSAGSRRSEARNYDVTLRDRTQNQGWGAQSRRSVASAPRSAHRAQGRPDGSLCGARHGQRPRGGPTGIARSERTRVMLTGRCPKSSRARSGKLAHPIRGMW